MSYKLGQLPSLLATQAEMADYLEVSCLLSLEKSFSIVEAVEDNGFVEDEDALDSPEIDEYYGYADALLQIDERARFANGRYPFIGEEKSVSLDLSCPEYFRKIYTFLLFATRWNMGSERIVNGKDGTLLFERLSNAVLTQYFGNHSKGMVFGTGIEADEKGFESKVKMMLNLFAEKGYQFRTPDASRRRQKDAKVDVIAFIPFNDNRKGQFVAFGQCKTGTSWRDKLGQLCPSNFCKLFIQPPLSFTPVCVYMVSEACENDWEELSVNSMGLLFDRTRIMQFLPPSLEDNLYRDISDWVEGVKEMIDSK